MGLKTSTSKQVLASKRNLFLKSEVDEKEGIEVLELLFSILGGWGTFSLRYCLNSYLQRGHLGLVAARQVRGFDGRVAEKLGEFGS